MTKIEIDGELLASFQRRCRRAGVWSTRVLDRLINSYLDAKDRRGR